MMYSRCRDQLGGQHVGPLADRECGQLQPLLRAHDQALPRHLGSLRVRS